MSDNQIKKVLEQVEPAESAKKRMYANIQKKAASASSTAPDFSRKKVSEKKTSIHSYQWMRYASLAAGLVIMLAAGAGISSLLHDSADFPDPSLNPPAVSEVPQADDSAENSQNGPNEANNGNDMFCAEPGMMTVSPESNPYRNSSDTQKIHGSNQSSLTSPGSDRNQYQSTESGSNRGDKDTEQGSQNSNPGNTGDDDDVTLTPSPFVQVSGPDDFQTLGFTITAPEDAQECTYFIAFERFACITFTWNGHSYTYSASKEDFDFSGLSGEVLETFSVSPGESSDTIDGILEKIQIPPAENSAEDSPSYDWKGFWKRDAIRFYLTNEDSAPEEDLQQLILQLMQPQLQQSAGE